MAGPPEHLVEVEAGICISGSAEAAKPVSNGKVGPAAGTANAPKRKLWTSGAAALALLAVVGISVEVSGSGSGQSVAFDASALGALRVRVREPGAASTSTSSWGFELVNSEYLHDYGYEANLYKHTATGAEVLSILSPDPNSAFGVALRTPPTNDKGTPHVLEHAVLGGSESYPTQHPGAFWRLVQSSPKTYANALTYPDRTLYPVSSANLQDFYNLVGIYLDAVFHPLVQTEELIFKQEGWRYELPDANDTSSLSIAGVVLNEMEGSYSSPVRWMYLFIRAQLFPDTQYVYDSGGAPWAIPTLEYEELQQFYTDLYHPSNSRVFFYGNDPEEERLKMLNATFEGFGANEDVVRQSKISPQPLFNAPRIATSAYPGKGDDLAMVSVGWVLSAGTTGLPSSDDFAMSILSSLLLGDTTSQLYKRLQDSGLGSVEPSLSGYAASSMVQATFYISMNSVEPSNTSAYFPLVRSSLEAIASEGFTEVEIDAAINSLMLALQTLPAESTTWGVAIFQSIAGPWAYGRDIFKELQFSPSLDALRERLAAGEDVFGDLIRTRLLDNPHRVDLTMVSSPNLAAQIDSEKEEFIASKSSSLASDESVELAAETAAFAEYQAASDTPEAIATIPILSIADLDDTVEDIPVVVAKSGSGTLLEFPQPTAGVLYMNVVLHTDAIEEEDLILLPLLAAAITSTGTTDLSASEVNTLMGQVTGGVSADVGIVRNDTTDVDGNSKASPIPYLTISGKSEQDMAENLTQIIGDFLFQPGLDRADAQTILTQLLDSFVISLSNAWEADAYTPAVSMSKAMIDPAYWVSDQTSGLAQLQYLREWQSRLDTPSGWPELKESVEKLMYTVLSSARPVVSITGDVETLEVARQPAQLLLDAILDRETAVLPPKTWNTTLPVENVALQITGGNNYVAQSADLASVGYAYSGSSLAANNLLSAWLYQEIRATLGAYGAYSSISSQEVLTLTTYRDPGLQTTIEAFSQAGAYLQDWAEYPDLLQLKAAIVKGWGSLNGYTTPSARGATGLKRYLSGLEVSVLQTRLDQLLATEPADIGPMGQAMTEATYNLVASTTEVNATYSNGDQLFNAVIPISPAPVQ